MPMYKYIDSNNKYIQQNCQMNVYIHILIFKNLGYGQLTVKSGYGILGVKKSGIWDIGVNKSGIWDIGVNKSGIWDIGG